MARFAFASSEEKTNDAGETVKTIRWHQVVAWGKCAAMVQQKVKKGKKISIVGKNSCRRYTGKDGRMYEKPEIVLYNFHVFEPQPA
jgi:single-strand DNA-binding protein